MGSSYTRGVDARGSAFYDIARDQINFHNIVNICSGPNLDHILQQILRPIADTPSLRSPNSGLGDRTQRRNLVFAYFSQASCGPDGDILRLISRISRLLEYDDASSSFTYGALKAELELLELTLIITGFGIMAYEATELGQNFARAVSPVIEQCITILLQLFHVIDTSRQGLRHTRIRDFWSQVWRGWCKVDELAMCRKQLFACRSALGTFVMALHSVSWTQIGNELRAGQLFLEDFLAIISCGPSSLRDVQVCKVVVVDHLGGNIPVPTVFFSVSSSFHYIIKHYCKNRPGVRYIERGDYRLLRSDNSHVVSPSEFSVVQPGTRLEMSIILRESAGSHSCEARCPRCRYMNLTDSAIDGWINARLNCSLHFQVVQDGGDDGNRTSDGHKMGQGLGEENGEQLDEARRRDEVVGKYNAETTSPDSRPQGNNDAEVQYFRRISVLLLVISSEAEYRVMLTQLEEQFICSMCYEVMAAPYSLKPCGHTFCSLCILKWFFSRLHSACGGWHTSVDCPCCYASHCITPDRVPRSELTFPFTPNRMADSTLQDLIGKLATPSKVKDEPGVKKQRTKKSDTGEATEDVAAWKEGGVIRTEWLKRDSEGRAQMKLLTAKWTHLNGADFILLKNRLGV